MPVSLDPKIDCPPALHLGFAIIRVSYACIVSVPFLLRLPEVNPFTRLPLCLCGAWHQGITKTKAMTRITFAAKLRTPASSPTSAGPTRRWLVDFRFVNQRSAQCLLHHAAGWTADGAFKAQFLVIGVWGRLKHMELRAKPHTNLSTLGVYYSIPSNHLLQYLPKPIQGPYSKVKSGVPAPSL